MAGSFHQVNGGDPAAVQRRNRAAARRRARPWWLAGGCGAVVLASLAGGLAVGANHAPTLTHQPGLAAADEASTPTWAQVTTAAPRPAAPLPVTPAAIIYRLQQLLPAGKASDFSGSTQDGVAGQLYLDRGQGPGMLRLDVAPPSGDSGCTSSGDTQVTCERLADGDTAVVERISDNCVQSLIVTVDHANGAQVQLAVGTCLAWNGTTNPPGGPALTASQAVRIADDPSWGLDMSATLVAAAQQQFPDLAGS